MRALMVTGMDLVEELLRTGGTLSPQMTSLAFDYLAVVQVLGTSDFFDQCLSVSRLSRDTRVVEGARRAARALSGSH